MISTVLFVPGLRDHVADHWQTLLAAQIPGSHTVAPLKTEKLSRAARVAALDRALAEIEGPVILAAHSAGCLTVAHWALVGRRQIQAALLVTPADIELPLPVGYPTLDQLREGGWLPLPRSRLPFDSLVIGSENDPLAGPGRAAALARDWGSAYVSLGEVGHLNPASGFGPWAQGLRILEALDRVPAPDAVTTH